MADSDLPLPQKLALAHAGGAVRPILEPFLALDSRLGEFVSQAKEPILTQMRIAWWRDQLAKPVADRPKGDPILDAIGQYWQGEEQALTGLVDGWEGLLAEPPLPESAAGQFVEGRAACFAATARLSAFSRYEEAALAAGRRWGWADLAARLSDAEERQFVLDQSEENAPHRMKLPRALRSLTILKTLGDRALDNSGRSLASTRADLLVVIRLGIFGR
ncbi:hypothetical protein [Pontixanthobacter aquaemixtae]|uniref:Phytoene synthase n=1 Tax=Pontixanthobacter aquaemixtae TaxID=1958940 RepID=A0A844ZS16_9SPHN|nr:hypothetical protein [Pontixanthobacter aquaemixtae]MXO90294.1 hypothetical protein [Pontixanthobacter aquaemixtae]